MTAPTSRPTSSLPVADRVRLLSGANFWQTEAADELGLDSLTVADGPHGLRVAVGGVEDFTVLKGRPATGFPPSVTVGSSWDVELAERLGDALGEACVRAEIDVLLGPGLNLKRHPHCGRNFEYFAEDPLHGGLMAAAVVRGIQRHPVGACLKHFAANNQESHRNVAASVVDPRTFRELYLRGFEIAIRDSSPLTVMCAYNPVGQHLACENRELLTTMLRGELGFDGLVMSDWGATNDRALGVHAGLDLQMPGAAGVFDGDVLDALHSGRLAHSDVDLAVDRLRSLAAATKARRGTIGYDPRSETLADMDHRHHQLAVEAAAAGSVLLANDGVLPLRPGASVALLGAFAESPRTQGGGSSQVTFTRFEDVRTVFSSRWGADRVTYLPVYRPDMGELIDGQLAEAETLAASHDLVVVLAGLPSLLESEGYDRTTSALPPAMDELIVRVARVNPRTVVVLSNGSPVTMPWADEVGAILESYLGGQGGAQAIVDLLVGDREPGGRLAETFALDPDDLAARLGGNETPRIVEYRENLYVGYRFTATAGVAVRFPFGHGGSYTTTEWSDPVLSASELTLADRPFDAPEPGGLPTVAVTVTNTGERAGSDVVQVYVERPDGYNGPNLQLAGFAKVHLEPGASQRVEVQLDALAFHTVQPDAGVWTPIPGRHRVLVARSSTDVAAALAISITADGMADVPTQRADLPWRPTDAEFAALHGSPLPVAPPLRPFGRDSTFAELATTPVIGVAMRLARPMIRKFAAQSFDISDPGVLDRMADVAFESPLRVAAANGGGKATLEHIDAVASLANGQYRAAMRVIVPLLVGTVTAALRRRGRERVS